VPGARAGGKAASLIGQERAAEPQPTRSGSRD
jgi:hypothetical protein